MPIASNLAADTRHVFFNPDLAKAQERYINLQEDGSYGSLKMDSPRIIEIHAALEANKYKAEVAAVVGTGTIANPQIPAKHTLAYEIIDGKKKVKEIHVSLDAEKYSTNELSTTDPKEGRVSTLAWHINRQSQVLGIRVDANGEINRELEKSKYNPQILNNPQYAEGDYGVTCWGKYGMVIPRLITEYDGSGQLKQPYHVVYDLPQQLRALQSDVDTALSLQHGTEIRTRDIDGNVGKYPNQLALILDMHRRTQAIELYSQRSYNLNTVSNAEIRGLYGGLGIPVSQQFINATNLIGKTGVNRKLPYFSYQKGQQTIASRFTTIEVNLGIILGAIMPKSQTEKQKILNPFKRFIPSK